MKKTAFIILSLLSCLICHAQKPEEPVLDSVSIDPLTNKVKIGWHVGSTIPDMGYIIFRQIFVGDPQFVKPANSGIIDDKGYYPIDTVYSQTLSNSYTDDVKSYYGKANPLYHPVSYKIRSINAKASNTGSASCDPNSTMMLLPVLYNRCLGTNTLRWYPYQGWAGSIKGYDIFVKFDKAVTYTWLFNVPATDSFYVDKQVFSNTNYSYYVKCLRTDDKGSSSSNFVTTSTPIDSLPKTLILDYVSVENNNIKLSVSIDPSKQAQGYYILRGDSANAKMDTVTRFENAITPFVFNDLNARTDRIYFYEVMVKNICGIPYKTTDYSNNIVLYATSSVSSPNNNHLDWSQYKNWTGGVMDYKVYRSVDNGTASLVRDLSSTSHSYDDDISSLKQNSSTQIQKVCYYIEAEEGNAAQLPVPGFAKSNVVCVYLDAKIEMPNAFNPSSKLETNRFFKPNFDQADGYQMIVYDRWGFKIFESHDPKTGWAGRSQDNNLVPEGVYVYYLTYSAGGKKLEQSGTVTVVSTND